MKKRSLRLTIIVLGMMFSPLAVYIGFCIGREEWMKAFVALVIDMLITCLYDVIYWNLMERLSGDRNAKLS